MTEKTTSTNISLPSQRRASDSSSAASIAHLHSPRNAGADTWLPQLERRSPEAVTVNVPAASEGSLSATVVVVGQHSQSSTGTAIVHGTPLSDALFNPMARRRRSGSMPSHATRTSASDEGSVIVHRSPELDAIAAPCWAELLGNQAAGASRRHHYRDAAKDDGESESEDEGSVRIRGSFDGGDLGATTPRRKGRKKGKRKVKKHRADAKPTSSVGGAHKGRMDLRARLIVEQRRLARKQELFEAQKQHLPQSHPNAHETVENAGDGEREGTFVNGEGSGSPSPERPSGTLYDTEWVEGSVVGPARASARLSESPVLFHLRREQHSVAEDDRATLSAESTRWLTASAEKLVVPPDMRKGLVSWEESEAQPFSALISPPHPLLSQDGVPSLGSPARENSVLPGASAGEAAGAPVGRWVDHRNLATSLVAQQLLEEDLHRAPMPLVSLFVDGPVPVTPQDARTRLPLFAFDALHRRRTGALFATLHAPHRDTPSVLTAATRSVSPPLAASQPSRPAQTATGASTRSNSLGACGGDEAEAHARVRSSDTTVLLHSPATHISQDDLRSSCGGEHRNASRMNSSRRDRRRRRAGSGGGNGGGVLGREGVRRSLTSPSDTPLSRRTRKKSRTALMSGELDQSGSFGISGALNAGAASVPPSLAAATAAAAASASTFVTAAKVPGASTRGGHTVPMGNSFVLGSSDFSYSNSFGHTRPVVPVAPAATTPVPVTAASVGHNLRCWSALTRGTLSGDVRGTGGSTSFSPRPSLAGRTGGGSGEDNSCHSSPQSPVSPHASASLGAFGARRGTAQAVTVRVLTVTAGALLDMLHAIQQNCGGPRGSGETDDASSALNRTVGAPAQPFLSPSWSSLPLGEKAHADAGQVTNLLGHRASQASAEQASSSQLASSSDLRSDSGASDRMTPWDEQQTWQLTSFPTQHARSSTNQPKSVLVTTDTAATPTTANHRYARSFVHGSRAELCEDDARRRGRDGGAEEEEDREKTPTTTRALLQPQSDSSLGGPRARGDADKDNVPQQEEEVAKPEKVVASASVPISTRFDRLFLPRLEEHLRKLLNIAEDAHVTQKDATATPTVPPRATNAGQEEAVVGTTVSKPYITLPVLGLELQMLPYGSFAPRESAAAVSTVATTAATTAESGSISGPRRSATLQHRELEPNRAHRHSAEAAKASHRQAPDDGGVHGSPCFSAHDQPSFLLPAEGAPALAASHVHRYGVLTPSDSELHLGGDAAAKRSPTVGALPCLLSNSALFGGLDAVASTAAQSTLNGAGMGSPVSRETPVLAIAIAYPTVRQGNVREAYTQWVRETHPTPVEREFAIRNILKSVLHRLAALHSTGCAHGSVKGTNLFATAHAVEAVLATTPHGGVERVQLAAVTASERVSARQNTSDKAFATTRSSSLSPTVSDSARRASTIIESTPVGVPRYSASLVALHTHTSPALRRVPPSSEDDDDAIDDPVDGSHIDTAVSPMQTPTSLATSIPRARTEQATARPTTTTTTTGESLSADRSAKQLLTVTSHGTFPAHEQSGRLSRRAPHRDAAAGGGADTDAESSTTPSSSSRGSTATVAPPVLVVDLDGASDLMRWSTDVLLVDETYATIEHAVRCALIDVVGTALEARSAQDFVFPRSVSASPDFAHLDVPSSSSRPHPHLTTTTTTTTTTPAMSAGLERWLLDASQQTSLFPLSQAELIPPPECITDEGAEMDSTKALGFTAKERMIDRFTATRGGESPNEALAATRSGAAGDAESSGSPLPPPPVPQYPFRLHSLNTDAPEPTRSLAGDMWMLGMLALELADGPLPEEQKQRCRPRPTLACRPWSSHFANFTRRCLEADPARRPTCADLLSDPWFTATLMAVPTIGKNSKGADPERVLSLLKPPHGYTAGSFIKLHADSTRGAMTARHPGEHGTAGGARGGGAAPTGTGSGHPSSRHMAAIPPTKLYARTAAEVFGRFRQCVLRWLCTTVDTSGTKKRRSLARSGVASATPKTEAEPVESVSATSTTAVMARADEHSLTSPLMSSLDAKQMLGGSSLRNTSSSPCNTLLSTQLPQHGVTSPLLLSNKTQEKRLQMSSLGQRSGRAAMEAAQGLVLPAPVSPSPTGPNTPGSGRESESSNGSTSTHHSLKQTLPMANMADVLPLASPESPAKLTDTTVTSGVSPGATTGMEADLGASGASSASSESQFDVPSTVWTSSDEDDADAEHARDGGKAPSWRTEKGVRGVALGAPRPVWPKSNVSHQQQQQQQRTRLREGLGQNDDAPATTSLTVMTTAVELCRRQAQLEGQLFRRHAAVPASTFATRRGSSASTSAMFGPAVSSGAINIDHRGTSLVSPIALARGRSSSVYATATRTTSGNSLTAWAGGSVSSPVGAHAQRTGRQPSVSADPLCDTNITAPQSITDSCLSTNSSFFLYSDDEEAVAEEVAAMTAAHGSAPNAAGDVTGVSRSSVLAAMGAPRGANSCGSIRFEQPPPLLLKFGDHDEEEDVSDATESEKQLTNILQSFLALYWKHPFAADAWSLFILRQLSSEPRTVELAKGLEALVKPPHATSGGADTTSAGTPAAAGSAAASAAGAAIPGDVGVGSGPVRPTSPPPKSVVSATSPSTRAETAPSLFNNYEMSKWIVTTAALLEAGREPGKESHVAASKTAHGATRQ